MSSSPFSITPSDLHEGLDSLIEMLESYSRERAALWQKIPWCALHAAAHRGMTEFSQVYQLGRWQINDPVRGGYIAYVDCATGDICGWSKGDRLSCASGIMSIFSDLDSIDPQKIIDRLNADMAKPYPESVKVGRENWLRCEIRTWDVQEVYVRPQAPASAVA